MMTMISIAWGKLELTCAVLALSVDRPMFLLLSDDFRCYSSFDQWHWSRSCVPFVGSHSGLLTCEGAYELFMSLRHNLVQVILWRKVLSLTCPRLLCGTTWDFPRRLIVSVVTRSWGDRAGEVEIFVGNKYTEFRDGDKKEQLLCNRRIVFNLRVLVDVSVCSSLFVFLERHLHIIAAG